MPSYVSSAEMEMLDSVLDEICLERGHVPGLERNLIAAQIMDLFSNGVSERSELLSALRGRNLSSGDARHPTLTQRLALGGARIWLRLARTAARGPRGSWVTSLALRLIQGCGRNKRLARIG